MKVIERLLVPRSPGEPSPDSLIETTRWVGVIDQSTVARLGEEGNDVTKGLRPGDDSIDDRPFISVELEPEPAR